MKQEETDKRTEKRKIGDAGEEMACMFLVKRGFEIVERNYSKKWGEIDIIARRSVGQARKDNKLHFIEVKTVSHLPYYGETDNYRPKTDLLNKSVRPNNHYDDCYRPEDNLHPWKLQRLSRVIQTYLLGYKGNRGVSHVTGRVNTEVDWQFDVATVYLDLKTKEAKVNYLEDIIL